MTTRRVTIDDVAAAAGVSRQTVSNVLRGTGRVGASTAARIREVVDKLGYAPHPGASSLRSRRTRQVAYPLRESSLAPDNVIVMEFIRSFVRAAGDQGYHVLLTSTGASGMRELIRSGRVDGFVFSDMFGDDDRLEIVDETHTPFACFGRTPAGLRQAWVDVDNVTGTRRATEHMIELGHRSISFFGFEPIAYWDVERRDGYLDAMRSRGLDARVMTPPNDQAAVTEAATALLLAPARPTAVVCSSDSLAVSVYRAAALAGLTIGEDLSVSGFDSSVIGRSLVPSLTTLRVEVDQIAALVMQKFLAELADPAAPAEGLLVVPELLPGASAAAPPPPR